MSYKTILTVLTSADTKASALSEAAALATAQDGHLEVLCLGLDQSHGSYYELGTNPAVMQAAIEHAQNRAQEVRDAAVPELKKTDARWDAHTAVAAGNDAGHAVVARGRFADIAVLPLPYRDGAGPEESAVLEGLLIQAGCPVLVVPPGASADMAPERVVIGWNESPEALRAVRAAMPVLKQAKEVHIAIIDPPGHAPDRSDPGGSLAVWLSRHGVNCDIQVMSASGERVSAKMARHVTETGSELLVMGGYGHSRFREALLGGATRDTLADSRVPVLMMH
ncbi:universal stress protein [Roseobacter ponti]|uniref:Universal stress protein n=1 Tax=Roseobacter ponti TaxID=1891787 RepID=A0A858SUR1_9RHOB|nr:universal stress protein [Roseobacter ponti]QJF52699.1 universal stress protein [Roseobacter ponti]